MERTRIEYMGFTVNAMSRVYRLNVTIPGVERQAVTLSIPNVAFTEKRVRYQDAPDICFLKLQRELLACGDKLPALHQKVTDAELEEYPRGPHPKAESESSKCVDRFMSLPTNSMLTSHGETTTLLSKITRQFYRDPPVLKQKHARLPADIASDGKVVPSR